MRRVNTRIALATIVVLAGIFVLGRAAFRLTRPALPAEHRDFPEHTHSPEADQTTAKRDGSADAPAEKTALELTLENASWLTPTAEKLDALAGRIAQEVDSAAMRLPARTTLGSTRRRDLVEIFRETFRLWQSPSMTKAEYVSLVESRGGRPTLDEGTSVPPGYQAYSLSPFSMDQIEVVPRYIGGRLETPWPDGASPGWTFYNPDMFDTPDDPRRGGLDVYEVRIPVKAPAGNFDTGEEGRVPAVVGFAYAWDEERRQWIPWRHWLYVTSEDRSAGWAVSALGLP